MVLEGETLFDRLAEDGIYPGLDRVRSMKKAISERLQEVAPVY